MAQREILFRGKRTGDRQWVYGYYFAKPILEKHFIEIGEEQFLVDSETVGQYTGLRDKNAQRIFEGDIVAGENYLFPCYDNRPLYIYWDAETGGFQLNSFNAKDIEVIGNIYDNPKLLGAEEKDGA